MVDVETRVGALKLESLVQFTTKESVTVLDWDDTLFASTHMEVFGGESRSKEDQEKFSSALDGLQTAVIGLLKRVQRVSRVFIVTNASIGWVQDVCQTVMPRVGDFLRQNGIQVVSARDLHQGSHPDSPVLWKLRAFKDILAVLRSISGQIRNVVVIGDSNEEHEAARLLRLSEHDMFIKMVKLPDIPPIDKLVRQLALLSMSFQKLWSLGRHFEIELD